MKIIFISPETKNGLLGKRGPGNFNIKKYGGAPLALPTLAALTPSDVEVKIIDENVEPINFDEEVDLVGISFSVSSVLRAYDIADKFKKRKVPVILGGIYASMLPNEAILHADSIVIGEAENIWPKVVADWSLKKLEKFYVCKEEVKLSGSIIPRWDLLKTDLYNYFPIQTTRGCPFDCDFCSVTWFFGGKYRHKSIEIVTEEIKFLKRIDKNKLIFFVDDNIVADFEYSKKLFKNLIPLNIKWFSQAPVSVAKDDELLKLMHESGCRELFIGFESLSQDSIDKIGKGRINKVEEYKKIIEKIHSYGISVFGSFMLGCEHDEEAIFKQTVKFINENNMPFSLINILVPPPGTRLFQKLEKEGRILHKNWDKYTGEYVCFEPSRMSKETLQKGYCWVLNQIYNYDILYKRIKNWWRRISFHKKRKVFFKNGFYLLSKFLFSIKVIFYCKKDKERVKYVLKTLWSEKSLPISIVLLSLQFHDYSIEFPKKLYKI